MAQLVKHPTLAQVMISQFVGSSPVSGSVLAARSLEPASDSGSPSLSAPPQPSLCLSQNECTLKKFKKNKRNTYKKHVVKTGKEKEKHVVMP